MRVITTIIAIGFSAGCTHHAATDPHCSPGGTWALRTINGAALPFTLNQSGAYKAEMVSVTLDAGADGRFTITSHMRESMNGQVSDQTSPDAGSYVAAGDSMTLRFSTDGKTTVVLVTCETLTMQERGGTYVFRRQLGVGHRRRFSPPNGPATPTKGDADRTD